MQVKIDKSFQKDVKKLKDKKILKLIASVIRQFQKIKKPSEMKNLKKLIGFGNDYRIRIGEYRIGITISGDTVEFVRLLHRRDIYKYFSK